MLRAGDLDDRITIEQRGPARTPSGQPAPASWVPHVTIWADVQHLSGTGAIKAGAETSTLQASIRVRRRTDLDPSMRVLFDSMIYKINAILPGKTKDHMFLVCEVTK